jgi:hypothetical protein
MRRITVVIALAAMAVVFVLAQQRTAQNDLPAYEVRSVFPREVSPAQYEQVPQRELQALADQGWELVSVMPYIYRNEEHGGEGMNPKPVVTQTYPAYFFKRPKPVRGR